MTARRIAANRVLVDGKELKQCVVELYAQGFVTSYYTFIHELPFTEWRGGTLRLRRDDAGRLVIVEG